MFNNFYRDGGQVSDDLIGQFVFCRYRQLFDPFMFKFCWLECVRDSFYHHPFFCVKVTEKEKERRTEEEGTPDEIVRQQKNTLLWCVTEWESDLPDERSEREEQQKTARWERGRTTNEPSRRFCVFPIIN